MKKNGYLLTELIVVLALAAIVSTMAAPVAVHRRRNQYVVDTTVSELVTEMRCLRTRSIGNRGQYGAGKLYVRPKEYVLTTDPLTVRKEQAFPKGVSVKGTGIVSFDGDGRPEGKTMHLVVETDDKRYKRHIIIAAQTGRIRTE